MTRSRAALWIVRAAARIVPAGARREWRREWEAELAWCGTRGIGAAGQCRRACGAWRHAVWLRRDQWRMEMLWRDVRLAARALRARPGFALTATLSLALGIGANVAIFTVVNGVLLRPLPFAGADRIVQLANGESPATLSGPELIDLAREAATLSEIGAYAFADANVISGGADAERVRIARVSAGFFGVLGPDLAGGRAFSREEDRPGAPNVIVISHGLAGRHFGGAGAATGRTLDVNGTPRVVIGVLPAGFDFPSATVDVWVPLALDASNPGERRNHSYRVIGRLAPGVGVDAARAEVVGLQAAWQQRHPGTYDPARPLIGDVVPIADRVLGPTRPYLTAMTGAVAAVLLIACVNVASLLLTHGEARRRDLAISMALGATRRRLAIRALAESAILAAAGGLCGVALAWPACRGLLALAPASIPRLGEVRVDPAVVGFAVLVSASTALASGIVPLLRTLTEADAAVLRGAGRSGSAIGGRATRRIHGALVIAEVALAVVLLSCAGLFMRSLINLRQTDLGFTPSGVLTARLSLPRGTYTESTGAAAVAGIVDRLRQAPGVRHAAAMAWTPVVDGGGMWSVMSDARTPASNGDAPVAAPQQVTPDFFDALSIPVLRGRRFTAADDAGADLVGIVNERFAQMLWESEDPIGRRFRMFSPTARWVTVVGLVADTRVDGLTDAKPPIMYFPHAQARESAYFTALSVTLAVRHDGHVGPVAAGIRQFVREADPGVPVSEMRGLDEVVGASMSRERFVAVLVAGFAGLAALLAGVGIHGVLAYGVAQRRSEIALRVALGAGRHRILADVVRRGLVLTAGGLCVGLAGAAAVGGLLENLLVGVSAFDPVVPALVSGVLLLVAMTALLVPAHRAMGVSPTETFRQG